MSTLEHGALASRQGSDCLMVISVAALRASMLGNTEQVVVASGAANMLHRSFAPLQADWSGPIPNREGKRRARRSQHVFEGTLSVVEVAKYRGEVLLVLATATPSLVESAAGGTRCARSCRETFWSGKAAQTEVRGSL